MRVLDRSPAFGGRIELALAPLDPGVAMPRHGIRPGQPVRIGFGDARVAGLLVRRSARAIGVVVDPEQDVPDEGPLRVTPSADEITPRRILADLDKLSGDQAPLSRVLFGEIEAEPGHYEGWLPSGLDGSQEVAARHALGTAPVALVHGPPGTGKTQTLAAIVRAAVRRGERVLVMAPSHTAVDNLVGRLDGCGLDLLRLGHPARVDPEVVRHALDVRLEAHEDVRLARRYYREASDAYRRADRFTRAKPAPGEKAGLRAEARALRADARRLEARAAAALLEGADVVFSTLGVDGRELPEARFDLAIVDEAGQATEASTWRAVLRAHRLVLGGDHLQLPPTVLSRAAVAQGHARSLFERLMQTSPSLGRRLTRQYRMHADIMGFSNAQLYDGVLEAAPAVAGHRLDDLPSVETAAETARVLRFVDTAGAGFDEEREEEGSLTNPREAALAVSEVRAWLDAGVPASAIGVITPYSAQARLLGELLGEAIEVDTIDGFQGREKEAVLISLVRSNPDQQVGFLSEVRRLNVALTRARRALTVLGDTATVGVHPFYEGLASYMEASQALVSVWEIPGAV